MSKMHRCIECDELQATGWGSEFKCLNCGGTDKDCLDHSEGEC